MKDERLLNGERIADHLDGLGPERARLYLRTEGRFASEGTRAAIETWLAEHDAPTRAEEPSPTGRFILAGVAVAGAVAAAIAIAN